LRSLLQVAGAVTKLNSAVRRVRRKNHPEPQSTLARNDGEALGIEAMNMGFIGSYSFKESKVYFRAWKILVVKKNPGCFGR